MENYVVYYFLGKVSEDTQRLSRWPQWEQCFPLFDEILSPYAKTARIKSSQNYVIPVRPRGNVTFKNVPKLAALRWTYENNKLWSESCGSTTGPYPVRHYETTIVSSKGKETPDICIFLYDGTHACLAEYLYNQELTVSIRESVHASRPPAYWDKMVGRLMMLFHAVRVGRAKRPWAVEVPSRPTYPTFTLGLPFFARGPTTSLDFSESLQTWDYIK